MTNEGCSESLTQVAKASYTNVSHFSFSLDISFNTDNMPPTPIPSCWRTTLQGAGNNTDISSRRCRGSRVVIWRSLLVRAQMNDCSHSYVKIQVGAAPSCSSCLHRIDKTLFFVLEAPHFSQQQANLDVQYITGSVHFRKAFSVILYVMVRDLTPP